MRRISLLALVAVSAVAFGLGASVRASDDPGLKPKDDGYRGIWFTLGQYSDTPYAKRFWDYGDKYSGGLGTYTAKHV
ncbi:MAG: hypothetical protein HQ582_06105, partial [Planctomycetes bacterium]|nr:hypothetical protein [Planctomycetota bacterium]